MGPKAISTDLEDASAPEDVARILRNAAQHYRESSEELASAWQDKHAGKCWTRIAANLERAADAIERIA